MMMVILCSLPLLLLIKGPRRVPAVAPGAPSGAAAAGED
jgi:hypothetical protein